MRFKGTSANIQIKLTVLPGVNVQELCKSIQIRVKESVEATMDVSVKSINVNIESVAANNQE